MATTTPTGYTIPAAATRLLGTATTAGWRTLTNWTPASNTNLPFLTIQVGRRGPNGRVWHYQITWGSYGCVPGRVRLSSSLARTPNSPQWHNGPSLKAIHAVITQHPVSPTPALGVSA
ncbi:hypothetical protein [Streptomyces cinereoruber]|uniref:hypothetical protein n=1 Tax=Streptomyces cinereoruber TaxID=67260 RepID=UPI003639A994